MSNAFRFRSECPDVPSIDAIEGSLIFDCDVDPAPPPIYEFPLYEFPMPNPPGFDFGCYSPQVIVNFTELSLSSDPSTSAIVVVGRPSFSVEVIYPNREETGQCEPVFVFNVAFPRAIATCPVINTSATFRFNRDYEPPQISFSAERNEERPEECEFDFNFNMSLPCASIEAKTSVEFLAPGGLASLDVEVELKEKESQAENDVCQYQFNMGLSLPCASLDAEASIIFIPAGNAPSIEFTASFDDSEGQPSDAACMHKFKLDLYLPSSDEQIARNLQLPGCALDPHIFSEWDQESSAGAVIETAPGFFTPVMPGETYDPGCDLNIKCDAVALGNGGLHMTYDYPDNWSLQNLSVAAGVRLHLLASAGKHEHQLTVEHLDVHLPEFKVTIEDGGDLEVLPEGCEDTFVLSSIEATLTDESTLNLAFERKKLFINYPETLTRFAEFVGEQWEPCVPKLFVSFVELFDVPEQIPGAPAGCMRPRYVLDVALEPITMPDANVLFWNGSGWSEEFDPGGLDATTIDCDGGEFVTTNIDQFSVYPGCGPNGYVLTLHVIPTKYKLACTVAATGFEVEVVPDHAMPISDCCQPFTFVESVDLVLEPGEPVPEGDPPNPAILKLLYTDSSVSLPEVVMGDYWVGDRETVLCGVVGSIEEPGYGWTIQVLDEVYPELNPACPPCGKLLHNKAKVYELIWPEPGANVVPLGPYDVLKCCNGVGTGTRTQLNVIDADTLKLKQGGDDESCGYHLEFTPVTIILPAIDVSTGTQIVSQQDCVSGAWRIGAVTGLRTKQAESEGCSPICAVELLVDEAQYVLKWPEPGTSSKVNNFDYLGKTDQCEYLDVLIEKSPSAYQPRLELGTNDCGYALRYETRRLRLPVLKMGEDVTPFPVTTVNCSGGKWSFTTVTGLTVADADSMNCTANIKNDKDLRLSKTTFELALPDPGTSSATFDLTPAAECSTLDVVIASTAADLKLTKDGCSYAVSFKTKRINILKDVIQGVQTTRNDTATCTSEGWTIEAITAVNVVEGSPCGKEIQTQLTTWTIPIKFAKEIKNAEGTPDEVSCDGGTFEIFDPSVFTVELIDECTLKYTLQKKQIKITCETSSGGGGCVGGLTTSVDVVCGVKCVSGNFVVCVKTLGFTDGCLTSAGSCAEDSGGGECP